MAFEFYMTEFGKAALIHGLAGGSIAFNVIEIGGAEIPPSDFSKVTALADSKLNTKAISQKQIDNTLNLKFQFDNKKVSSDFFWTEIGYFATVTKSDGNTENGMVLYGYNSKETANHIPSYTSNNTLNKYICQIGINYSDDLNVTSTLDEFEDYAKAAHVHSTDDITSGVLGVLRGGTGGNTGIIKSTIDEKYTMPPNRSIKITSLTLEKGVWIVTGSVGPIYDTNFDGNIFMSIGSELNANAYGEYEDYYVNSDWKGFHSIMRICNITDESEKVWLHQGYRSTTEEATLRAYMKAVRII